MKYKISPQILMTSMDGESIILNRDTGQYIALNITASTIFECINDGISETALLEKLKKIFKVSNNDIEQDTKNFLKECIEKKIVFVE